MLAGLIICLCVGVPCAALGLVIWKRRNISLIHRYHRTRVRKEDTAAYTRMMGLGLLCIGSGACLTGLTCFLLNTLKGWAFFILCFAAGIALFLRAQKKYQENSPSRFP